MIKKEIRRRGETVEWKKWQGSAIW
jgi:hypothetical protein